MIVLNLDNFFDYFVRDGSTIELLWVVVPVSGAGFDRSPEASGLCFDLEGQVRFFRAFELSRTFRCGSVNFVSKIQTWVNLVVDSISTAIN